MWRKVVNIKISKYTFLKYQLDILTNILVTLIINDPCFYNINLLYKVFQFHQINFFNLIYSIDLQRKAFDTTWKVQLVHPKDVKTIV